MDIGVLLVDAIVANGGSTFTGVPCSLLDGVIEQAATRRDVRYVVATSEGEATGMAMGAWLAGARPVAFCQNSGLGNMVNPLATLAHPCSIPLLVLCSWRGRPGVPDEPQHALMGRATLELLRALEIDAETLTGAPGGVDTQIARVYAAMERRQLPFCLVVDRAIPGSGMVLPASPAAPPPVAPIELDGVTTLTRAQVLSTLLETVDGDTAIVATTGKTGRELYTLADREQHFYHVGAMGCASAVALGVALNGRRRVVVVDGDGAALMKLGNMATIGATRPPGFVHLVLDNGVHDSTGAQPTSASAVRFALVASACGYRTAASCASLRDLEDLLRRVLATPGPHLVHVRIKPGSMTAVGRPRVHPAEVARRFRSFVTAADQIAGSRNGVVRTGAPT